MVISCFSALWALLLLLLVSSSVAQSLNGTIVFPHPPHSDETFTKRTYFYVGGEYQYAAETNGTLRVGQIYVEKLAPQRACRTCLPLVFWAGAAQTATNWLKLALINAK